MFKYIIDALIDWVCPTTKIYKRLKTLWEYTQNFDIDQLPKIRVIPNEHVAISFEFDSALGTRVISMDNWELYSLCYADTSGQNIFQLRCSSESTVVTPNLGEELTAQDIDLALLELERYFQINLPNLNQVIYEKQCQQLQLRNKHENQVHILEKY